MQRKNNVSWQWHENQHAVNTKRCDAARSCLVTCQGCFSQAVCFMVMFAEANRCVFYTWNKLSEYTSGLLCAGRDVCLYLMYTVLRVCQENSLGTGSVGRAGRPGRQHLPLEAFKSTYTGFLGLFMFLWKISLWNPWAAHFNLICEAEWCWDRAWERQGLGGIISFLTLFGVSPSLKHNFIRHENPWAEIAEVI